MRGNLNQPDFMYEATRVYLMLGGSGPLDKDLVREWMTLDWASSYPGPGYAPLRASLLRHLDALLQEPPPAVLLDGELVAQARATFSRVTLAQRIYSRIRPSAAAQRLPPWRPSDALGAAGVRVFIRSSGKPLSDGIPGFYTVDGFYKVLLPSLARASQDVASESWVLGERMTLEADGPQMRAAQQAVITLYTTEYAQAWDAMLADLDLAPLRSLTQAAQDLYIVSAQQSPMRALLVSAARQVGLAAAGQAPAQPSPEPAAEGGSRLGPLFNRAASAEPATIAPGHEIDDHFKPLRDLVGTGAGAPIDQVLKPLVDLQQQLAKIAASNRRGAPPPTGGDDPAVALRTEALRQPQPLARWLNSIAASGAALRGGGAKQQILAAFSAGGGPAALCPQIVNNRYPFTPRSTNEASLEDFGKLFGPGGALDAFFNTQLKPYVDMSARPWKTKEVDGVAPPVTAADLAQFQRAAAIRDMFFPRGGTVPQIRFDITALSMDAGATQVTLDLGPNTLAYTRGPPRPTQVTWPGTVRAQPAKLSWEPAPADAAALQDTGPWALFRLFGRGRMQAPGTGERSTLTFQSGDRQAAFDIRAAPNPFASTLLQEFRCPSVQ